VARAIDGAEALMAEGGRSFWSQHTGNILVAAIGAVGAIVAAVVPLVMNRTDPAPAHLAAAETKAAEKAPGVAKDQRPQVLIHLDRIQGTWESVAHEWPARIQATLKGRAAAKRKAAEKGNSEKPPMFVWEFHGNQLTTRMIRGDGADVLTFHGTFALLEGRGGVACLFECKGRNVGRGPEVEWLGVYEFDGDFLRICYRFHGPDDEDRARAFVFTTDEEHGGGVYFKFKKRP
jgi:hypothetical protein